jgi:large subunit ribosomal protein L19
MKQIKEKKISMNLVEFVESKYLKVNQLRDIKNEKIQVGDIIKVSYSIPEGNKERIQSYEGLIIAIQNRGLGKSFTLRRSVQGIGVEQIFLVNSPKISEITKKQSSKVRRSKLYFMRFLNGKSTRLKREF